MSWFQIQQSRSLSVARKEIEEKTEPLSELRDDLQTSDTTTESSAYIVSEIFQDPSNAKFNYSLLPRDGKPVRLVLYLAAFAYCLI